MNLLKTSLLAAALFAAAPMAMAGSNSASIPVSLTLQNSCTITAAVAGVNFGTVTTLASDIPATGTVAVTCTSSGLYDIAFNGGTTTGGTITQRLLKDPVSGNTINYNLFKEVAHTTLLGDGTTGSKLTALTGNGSAQSYTIFGLVPGGQGSKTPGTYTDSVTATVTF